MRQTLVSILNFFFPARCLSCGRDRPTPFFAPFPCCDRCVGRIRWFSSNQRRTFFAAASFDGSARDLIHALKYNGKRGIAGFFANEWLERCPFDLRSVDAVVPVPSSAWKVLKRGYNPAELLAREIAKRLGKPVDTGLLRRRWWSLSQTGLSRRRRIRNAALGFALCSRAVSTKKRTLLLVDDVFTTGATLGVCARLLRSGGGRRVLTGAAVLTI